LSNELENLPRVTPAYSLVDAILPRLEEYDRTGRVLSTVDSSAASAPTDLSSSGRKRDALKLRRFVSHWPAKALGGVVAAGLLIGVIIATYEPEGVQNAEDQYNLYMSDNSSSEARSGSSAPEANDAGSEAEGMTFGAADAETGTPEPAPAADTGQEASDGRNVQERSAPAGGGTDRPLAETDSSSAPDTPVASKDNDHSIPGQSAGRSNDEPVSQSTGQQPGSGRETASSGSQGSASDSPAEKSPEQATHFGLGFAMENLSEPVEAANKDKSFVSVLEYESPDGTMRAVPEGRRLKIYLIGEGEKLKYESVEREGEIGSVEWIADSKQLIYEVFVAGSDAPIRYRIDLERMTEYEEPAASDRQRAEDAPANSQE